MTNQNIILTKEDFLSQQFTENELNQSIYYAGIITILMVSWNKKKIKGKV